MNWRYQIKGSHTHVRVFMNGALCGTLCFRTDEFISLRHTLDDTVTFILESFEYEEATK